MDELTIEDKKYLSSRQAAKVTGYAKDYVGQLCREGRVEARLVGRNWYVLEESILGHRFGAEDQEIKPEPIAQDVASTWDTPVYKPEIVSQVPEFAPKAVLETPKSPEPVATNPAVLADMQSAWQDWFTEKPITPQEPEEALLEDHYDHPGEEIATTESVTIERIHNEPAEIENVEEREKYVPVAITRHQEPERVVSEIIPMPSRRSEVKRAPEARNAPRRSKKDSTIVIQALLVAVIVLAVAVAVIGSGAVDSYLSKTTFVSPVTNFIAGISQINK